MDTSLFVRGELTGDLDLLTKLSEAEIENISLAVGNPIVSVVAGRRRKLAGFNVAVCVRDYLKRVEVVSYLAVLIDAPVGQHSVVRDLRRERLDLRECYRQLVGGRAGTIGFALQSPSWTVGVLRDHLRLRLMRLRLIELLRQVLLRTAHQ